jgi:hypothetical protein
MAALHADSWQRHYRGAFSGAFLDDDAAGYLLPLWTVWLATPDPRARTIPDPALLLLCRPRWYQDDFASARLFRRTHHDTPTHDGGLPGSRTAWNSCPSGSASSAEELTARSGHTGRDCAGKPCTNQDARRAEGNESGTETADAEGAVRQRQRTR